MFPVTPCSVYSIIELHQALYFYKVKHGNIGHPLPRQCFGGNCCVTVRQAFCK